MRADQLLFGPVVASLAVIGGCQVTDRLVGTADNEPDALEPWRPGMLDIHHISTGRGDAAFFCVSGRHDHVVRCG